MGWWNTDEDGNSFVLGSPMYWGDGPADTMEAAIGEIGEQFLQEVGRTPTTAELIAGVRFSANDVPEEAQENAGG